MGPFEELLDHPLIGSGNGGIGNGVLGDVMDDYDELAINPFLLDDPERGLWLYFVAYTPISNIYVVPLSDPTTVAGDPTVLLEPDPSSWEGFVAEGVFVEPVDTTLHLMYSGNFVQTPRYAIGSTKADEATGPFVRNPNNPILQSSDVMGLLGPGHHSVTRGPGGGRVIVYHNTYQTDPVPRREVRAAPLCVDDDGNFFVGPP